MNITQWLVANRCEVCGAAVKLAIKGRYLRKARDGNPIFEWHYYCHDDAPRPDDRLRIALTADNKQALLTGVPSVG